jgi:hypothetical protein
MRVAFLLLLLFVASNAFSEEPVVLLDANFDTADLNGWRTAGDLCVAPAFCAGEPSGRYWMALSTNNSGDPISLCGFSSIGGMQTVLRSPDLLLPFPPTRIQISFKMKFLTNETTATDLGNDIFFVRFLTMAGPLVISSIDDSGPSPGSKNLTIEGANGFHESKCSPTWKYETGMLQVSYYRAFREPDRSKMLEGPVALEFSLVNQFDSDFDSAVVLDDVRIVVHP